MNTLALERHLAAEMKTIVVAAAAVPENQPAGNVKAQMRRAWEALGKPDFWRVRAAFQGYGGKWIGTAQQEFRDRDSARRRREAKHRADTQDTATLLAALRDRLAASDSGFFGEQIEGIGEALRAAGGRAAAASGPRRTVDGDAS